MGNNVHFKQLLVHFLLFLLLVLLRFGELAVPFGNGLVLGFAEEVLRDEVDAAVDEFAEELLRRFLPEVNKL